MIKYITFVQWRLDDKDGEPYGPRHVQQTFDPMEATNRFTNHVKFYADNIKQGDCHVELIANIDGEISSDLS